MRSGYVASMDMPQDPDRGNPTVHVAKGRIKRFLGWMTADRRAEAEGEAEVRTGAEPPEAAIEEVELEVKDRQAGTRPIRDIPDSTTGP